MCEKVSVCTLAAWPPGDSLGLELFDLSDFAEACLAKSKVEHVAATTEAVLLCLEDTTAFEVLVFLFDRKVHVSIDHVLELVRTSHLTGLVDLIDDQADCAGFLTEVGDLLEASNRRVGRDLTAFVHAIVEALKRVDDEDELVGGASFHHLACVVQDLGDVTRVTSAEAMLET